MRYLILFCFVLLPMADVNSQSGSDDIRLNQLGFLPSAQKIAVINNTNASVFEIRVKGTSQVVYSSSLSAAAHWDASDEDVRIADFSEYDALGSFEVYVDGKGLSHAFEIGNKVFNKLAIGTMKALYFNRASTALEENYAGQYARSLGHPDNQVIVLPSAASAERPAGTVISTPYGWYDAGDYNKYIVNSGISVFTYLSAYENFPILYDTLELNIPESGNDMPDILDETYWNLKWMATMQDPNDGGVYNKTTTANFSGAIMPDRANAQRYVVAKGTAATLDFAATMAMAARIYEPFLPDFASTCLTQAKQAWTWANANPKVAYNNPSAQDGYPAVNTGGYGDGNFTDEFVWAASELYITTQDDDYYAAANYNRTFNVPGWSNVETLALLSLSTHRDNLTSAADISNIRSRILAIANSYVNDATNHPYRIPGSNFWWGGNSHYGNVGMILLHAYDLTNDRKYYDAALHGLDYLMGRNATTYSFVTGYGDKTPMNIHHRQSEADGITEPVPGFLAGGSNPGNQNDDCGASKYPSSLPAKSYVDDWCSYSTNEITINWNAPLVYISGGLQYIYLRDFKRESNYEVVPLGIEEGQGYNFDIYPNPAGRELNIETKSIDGETKISIYNLSGELMYQMPILSSGKSSIDTSAFANGIYMLRYQNSHMTHIERVIFRN